MTAATATPAPASEPPRKVYPIGMGRKTRWLMLLFGVRGPETSQVTIEGDQVSFRFGFYRGSFGLDEITKWDITGPYPWIRAIAVRHTWRTQDISYCGDGHGAVRVYLKSARKMAWVPKVSEVYLGVANLEGFAAELTIRGIPGEDKRTKPASN
jgi:hypothetical protein